MRRGGRSRGDTRPVRRIARRTEIDIDGPLLAARDFLAQTGLTVDTPDAARSELAPLLSLSPDGTRMRVPAEAIDPLLAASPRGPDIATLGGLDAGRAAPLLAPVYSGDWLWSGMRERLPLTADHVRDTIAVGAALEELSFDASSLWLDCRDLDADERRRRFAAGTRPRLVRVDSPDTVRLLRKGDVAVVEVETPLALPSDVLATIGELASARRTTIVAPTLILGATVPMSVEGALACFAAATITMAGIIQTLGPGTRVVAGLRIAEASMRNGLPLAGTAGVMRTLLGGIAIARRLGLPVAALGPMTGAKGPDALAGANSAAWLSIAVGADIVAGLGGLELDAGLSLEKLVLDVDIAAALAGDVPSANRETLSAELAEVSTAGHALGAQTTRRIARLISPPRVPDDTLHETWLAAGRPDAVDIATLTVADALMRADAGRDAAAGTRLPAPLAPALPRLADLASSLYSRAMRDAFGFKG